MKGRRWIKRTVAGIFAVTILAVAMLDILEAQGHLDWSMCFGGFQDGPVCAVTCVPHPGSWYPICFVDRWDCDYLMELYPHYPCAPR